MVSKLITKDTTYTSNTTHARCFYSGHGVIFLLHSPSNLEIQILLVTLQVRLESGSHWGCDIAVMSISSDSTDRGTSGTRTILFRGIL
jgi:hypothetical protein